MTSAGIERLHKYVKKHPDAWYSVVENFHQGYTLDLIGEFLTADDIILRRTGVYITSEIGEEAKPLLSEIIDLLLCDDIPTVYYALDTLICIHPHPTKTLRKTIQLLSKSSDDLIKAHASLFLSQIGEELLTS